VIVFLETINNLRWRCMASGVWKALTEERINIMHNALAFALSCSRGSIAIETS